MTIELTILSSPVRVMVTGRNYTVSTYRSHIGKKSLEKREINQLKVGLKKPLHGYHETCKWESKKLNKNRQCVRRKWGRQTEAKTDGFSASKSKETTIKATNNDPILETDNTL